MFQFLDRQETVKIYQSGFISLMPPTSVSFVSEIAVKVTRVFQSSTLTWLANAISKGFDLLWYHPILRQEEIVPMRKNVFLGFTDAVYWIEIETNSQTRPPFQICSPNDREIP